MQAGVVGMGIMGRLLAFALHHAGWQVTLFDKNESSNNCSSMAAGMLAPLSELDKADALIFYLGQESLLQWPQILKSMPEIYFQQLGSIVLCHPNDEAEWHHYRRRIATSLDRETSIQSLTNRELIQCEPELSKFEKAYYFPNEAQIDCQAFMQSLQHYLETAGVRCFNPITILSISPHRIESERGIHDFDMVFDCRGLGAKAIFTDLRPLRGELLCLYAPDVTLHRPIRLLHPRYCLYVVPRPEHLYLVGASEMETDDKSPISVRTSLELLTGAYFIHPGFAEARVMTTWVNCRPTLANHLPKIAYTDGLIAVNGLYRHGYLIAPALAAEIVRYLCSQDKGIHYPTIWERLA